VIETTALEMRFDYRAHFGLENRTGYETLLYDAMIGDSTLFKRADMIEGRRGGELHFYPAGSVGPLAANDMLRRDGRAWRAL
jgi:glucose-6-phosphate 1-dehydrogenase